MASLTFLSYAPYSLISMTLVLLLPDWEHPALYLLLLKAFSAFEGRTKATFFMKLYFIFPTRSQTLFQILALSLQLSYNMPYAILCDVQLIFHHFRFLYIEIPHCHYLVCLFFFYFSENERSLTLRMIKKNIKFKSASDIKSNIHFISELQQLQINYLKCGFNAWVTFIILIQLVIHEPNFKMHSDECIKS